MLGGLGCGRTLLELVLEELADSGDADFVVLQATDQAIPFYEKMGFSKVGAVASFEAKGTELPSEALLRPPPPPPSMLVSPCGPPAPPPPPLGARLYWARRLARCILRKVANLDTSLLFWQPVSAEAVPTYREWVAQPIDFQTIRKRLVDGASPFEAGDAYDRPSRIKTRPSV